ncbi:hypothetical protein ACQP2X_49215 [Actinoplanes sp. CA-131856]
MFATMRRKSRSRRMKNELNQGVDHFKRAATLAAQETSATVGPTLTAAVDRVQPAAVKAKDAASSGWGSAVATITPLVAAASDNVKQAGKVSKKSAKQNKKEAKKLQKRASKAVSRKQKKGRGSKLLGFALLGTAIGVGAAYVNKRRRAAQWDEYEPAAPLTTNRNTSADDAAFEPDEPQAYTSSPNGTVPNPAPKTL